MGYFHSNHSTIDFVIGDGTLASIMEESAEEVKSLTAALM